MHEWPEEEIWEAHSVLKRGTGVLSLWGLTEEDAEQNSQMVLGVNPGSATY